MKRGVPIHSAEARRLVNRGPAWREHPDYYAAEPDDDVPDACPVCGRPGPCCAEVDRLHEAIPEGEISEQWLEPAARGIHAAVCGCNGPQHYTYYLDALRRATRVRGWRS